MSNSATNGKIDGSPVKSFFVNMLTRDIRLIDAILDLVDNCIDGALRVTKGSNQEDAFKGFFCNIWIEENLFSIEDNCGGIPRASMDYAFRMGKPDDRRENDLPLVGTFGIGMKRAVFKIGWDTRIISKSEDVSFELRFDREWMESKEWDLFPNYNDVDLDENGTKIVVNSFRDGVRESFGVAFLDDLKKAINTHYSFIMARGFIIRLNGNKMKPKPTRVSFLKNKILPYVFKGNFDGVKVFLIVGFTGKPIDEDPNEEENSSSRDKLEAGWTVLCNDRAVLYGDRTIHTGWGEAGVPRFHNQYLNISGIVRFESKNVLDLPVTTNKRGLDTGSELFAKIKGRIREGTKQFTGYTNKWKQNPKEYKRILADPDIEHLTLNEIEDKIGKLGLSLRRIPREDNAVVSQSRIILPKGGDEISISYKVKKEEFEEVSEFLFDSSNIPPREVGRATFDRVMAIAKS